MRADEVANLDESIGKARSLLQELDGLESEVGAERPVLEEFRAYLVTLLRMLEEMAALAGRIG